MNANIESLTKIHGKEKAEEVFREIADIGGFGNIPTDYVGGLDVLSALDESNTAIPNSVKNRIAELSGVKRKAVDKKIASGEIIPPSSFAEETPQMGR